MVHRRSKGLAPPQVFKRWTSKEDNLLGTLPDAELAERLGRSAGEVRKRPSQPGYSVSRGGLPRSAVGAG